VDGELYGIGMIEPILDKWHELNTTTRQLMDNKTLQLLMPTIEDANANVQRDIRLTEFPRIKADDVNGVKPLPINDFSVNGYRAISALKDDMRRSSGAVDSIQGTASKGEQSATEFASNFQQAGVRLKNRIKLIEERLFKKFIDRSYQHDMQFAETERIVRVVGAKGSKLVRIPPEDIWGTFDIITHGPTQIENTVVKSNKLTNFFAIASKLQGVYNIEALGQKIWSGMGLPEAEYNEITMSKGRRETDHDITSEAEAMAFGQRVIAYEWQDHQRHLDIKTPYFEEMRRNGLETENNSLAFQENLEAHLAMMESAQANGNSVAQNGGMPIPMGNAASFPTPQPTQQMRGNAGVPG
jgi:hypothetical protein